jgi:hypothetical protein
MRVETKYEEWLLSKKGFIGDSGYAYQEPDYTMLSNDLFKY